MKKAFIFGLSCILMTCYSSPIVLAAPYPTSVQEEQKERARQEEQRSKARQEALERKEREERKDVFLQETDKSKRKMELPQEELNFFINNIEVEGAENFRWLLKQLQVYEKNHIGINGINLIMKEANNSLIERGFVTSRLVIYEQDLSSGTLKFHLIPGMVKDIFFDESSDGNWRSAFPTRPGAFLNLRDLEQGLEQLKRVSSQDADMQIVPADEEGQSNIVVTIKRKKPWKAVLSLDDSGSKATGKIQFSQTFSLDNIFKGNDLFNFSFNRDLARNGSQYGTRGHSFYYSRPSGNHTYTFSYNNYDYHQKIFAGMQPVVYSGRSKDWRFRAEKLLERNQNSKTHLELAVIHRLSKNYIDENEITVQRKKTTALTTALAHKKYIGQSVFDARLTHKLGMPWFNAQADLRESGFTTRYHIWNLDLSMMKPVKLGTKNAQYRISLSGQYSNNRLFTNDCFSIGSRYTVRGFSGEETLAGERGWYLQNELSLPLKNSTEIYMGLDYGQVGGRSTEFLQDKSLLGAVVGLRGALLKNCQYDVFCGKPLKKPSSFATNNETYGFQLVFQY